MAISQVKVGLDDELDSILKSQGIEYKSYKILKKSLDARKKNFIHYLYEIETFDQAEIPTDDFTIAKITTNKKVIIIGAGPAGLFAALRLVHRGISCQILERGKPILERMRDISRYWKTGQIDKDSNVCFGEGGAGTFSDGKLITRIKSQHIPYIMDCFIKFGAPEEIRYLANPHIGSNKIRKVIHKITQWLIKNGCNFTYNCRIEDFEFVEDKLIAIYDNKKCHYEADDFILATGHSAHDIYHKLLISSVHCESKSFAMGFRIEHSQKWVNQVQFGNFWQHPNLPVANYKLTYDNKEKGLGVYSFCMCPGGYVLASSAQNGLMVVNGMSNFGHGSAFANSGIVVTIDKDKWFPQGAEQALKFQNDIEHKAQQLIYDTGGSTQVPVQRVEDFLANRVGIVMKSSCPSGVIAVNLRSIYPTIINEALEQALQNFNCKMPGYLGNALLYGVESRTSSPIRIVRDKQTLQSSTITNLYPTGEGAGYAGGITSAAADGIKVVEAICEKYNRNKF